MTDKQYILGISAYYHDSSAAILCNGEIISAIAEERLSKIKHDKSFPRLAIAFCLEQANISSNQLDSVVFYEEPSLKFSRVLTTSLSGFPKSWTFFYHAMRRWMIDRLWTKIKICNELDISPDKVFYVPHHISHAAHAFFNSPFEQASAIIIDAVGEWTCTSIAQCDKQASTPIQITDEILYPNSIGLVYSAFTAFLGFAPNSDECSTMALAAFGQPVLEKEIQTVIKPDSKNGYLIDQTKILVASFNKNIFSQEFLERFGLARKTNQLLPFDTLVDQQIDIDADSERYANIAASLQVTLEKILFTLANKAITKSSNNKLCIAGGVANNCIAIQKLVEKYGADHIFVPLDPGDGGSAIGAAMAHYFRINKKPPTRLSTPYLGKTPQTHVLEEVLKNIHMLDWSRYLPATTRQFSAKDLIIRNIDHKQTLIDETAKYIHEGYIVGWVQGHSEFGPRALGNRSILADPANLVTARRLSEHVKFRAVFRPYALSVTDKAARSIFSIDSEFPYTAHWMQMTMAVKPTFQQSLRGALAIDGTTRPHICMREENACFYDLLTSFEALTGLAALLNTSFNEAGYPMVSSGLDALISFIRMDFDILVVDNIIIKKPWCTTYNT